MAKRECKYCGERFTPTGNRQLFCSGNCRAKTRRGVNGKPTGVQAVSDPTSEEIRERCLEVQATWDEATRRKRMGLPGEPEDWQPPVIRVEDMGLSNTKQTEE
jgi:hypothetical protein